MSDVTRLIAHAREIAPFSEDGQILFDLARELEKAQPRIIEKMLDLSSLPVGSVVRAHWPDNSQPDYQMTRCTEGGASAGGGIGLAGGSHWLEMANWGATLTVLHIPKAEETK